MNSTHGTAVQYCGIRHLASVYGLLGGHAAPETKCAKCCSFPQSANKDQFHSGRGHTAPETNYATCCLLSSAACNTNLECRGRPERLQLPAWHTHARPVPLSARLSQQRSQLQLAYPCTGRAPIRTSHIQRCCQLPPAIRL
eukprot:365140-Chlamydomonas_euryale.AAC.9